MKVATTALHRNKFKSKNNDRYVMEGNFKIQRVLKEIRDSEEAYLKQLTLLKTVNFVKLIRVQFETG